MIKTENLTRTYGKGEGKVTALDGVSLTINDGEMVAMIGKSGSGKSNAVRYKYHICLSRLLRVCNSLFLLFLFSNQSKPVFI